MFACTPCYLQCNILCLLWKGLTLTTLPWNKRFLKQRLPVPPVVDRNFSGQTQTQLPVFQSFSSQLEDSFRARSINATSLHNCLSWEVCSLVAAVTHGTNKKDLFPQDVKVLLKKNKICLCLPFQKKFAAKHHYYLSTNAFFNFTPSGCVAYCIYMLLCKWHVLRPVVSALLSWGSRFKICIPGCSGIYLKRFPIGCCGSFVIMHPHFGNPYSADQTWECVPAALAHSSLSVPPSADLLSSTHDRLHGIPFCRAIDA